MLACALLALSACKDETARQPPPPEAKPATCETTPKYADPNNVQQLPAKAGGFCLDPAGSDKGYGEGTGKAIDGICDLFDGECEIYIRFGVRRVVEVRYLPADGSAASIDVILSKFASSPQAYGMFTQRVVGDGDPAHPDTSKPIAGGGAAALGIGNAYLYRGQFLAELTYNEDALATKDLRSKADALLPPLVEQIASGIPGRPVLPPAAAALPQEDLLPLGIRYVTKDVLGISGAGPGAFGYYRRGEQRWRVLSVVGRDADQAADVLRSIAKAEGAKKLKGVGDAAVQLVSTPPDGGPQAEWVVAHRGKNVRGIGDERHAIPPGLSAEQRSARTLTADEKRKRLDALLP